ncbi:glycosyltransferase [Maricaulis sp.]|uniref:glycosyltransferase n=1 Tax=Maricaulis sp. TaxID=1486257 RepID=UPI003511EBA1
MAKSSAPQKTAILVLGMHRSGTSACTRIANLFGAALPEDVLPANAGNETGYWEPRSIVDFNERLLEAQDFGWDDPVPESRITASFGTSAIADAAALVGEVYGDAPLIVIKDPRCALIPGFWIEAVTKAGYRPVLIHCRRAAADVAASLDRRDGMSADEAGLLWAQSNTSTLRVLGDAPNLVLDYGADVVNWPDRIFGLADIAGFAWPRNRQEVEDDLEAFLKPARSGADARFSATVAGIVGAVDRVLEGGGRQAGPEVLDRIDAEIAAATSILLATHKRFRRQLAEAKTELAIKTAEAERAEAVIADAMADLETARGDQKDAEDRAKAAQETISGLETDLRTARGDQKDAEARAASAQAVISGLEADLEKARADQAEADARAKTAQGYIHELETLRDELRARLETVQGEKAELESSLQTFITDFKALEASVQAYREHADRLEAELADTQVAYRQADSERIALRLERDHVAQRLEQIENSTIWRATDPLRRMLRGTPWLTRWTRRGLKLVWWTVTLQLPARLSARHDSSVVQTEGETAESVDQVLPPLDRLAGFLGEEFGPDAAATTTGLIEKYQLPFQREGMPAIATVTPDETARDWAQSLAEIAPAGTDAPRVSIIVPAYNQIAFTLACIESVFRSQPSISFEILVGDDKSSDGTLAAAEVDIPNVRWIRHDPNLGFVRNCNATAAEARGSILVFLNNDTLVLPGWLDELVATLDGDVTIGMAGSKLIYPDGRLQEAGGIFWQDGSAWNLGRFDDPRRPEFSYAREVDYISGAAIALPRPVWDEMGGFDELFVPAYAEDADLAFRLRKAGYRTLLQPRSQLLHFEGVSSGTDTGSGIKAHQVTNLERFKERWSEVLQSHRPNGQLPQLEKERSVRQRALFVDITTPEPDHDAGSVVAVECMRGLQASGFKVTFVPQDNFLWTREFSAPLQRAGIETIYHPFYSRFTPFAAERGSEFDLVFLHRYPTAERTLTDIRQYAPQARVVLLNADLHYLREMREAELSGDADAIREAERTRERELAVMAAVDLVLTHSTVELEILQAALGAEKVMLLPLIHDAEPTPAGFAERRSIGFLGGFGHPPNVDAVDWFLDEVWPRVRAVDGKAEFALAGSKMPDRYKRLDGRDGISVLGFVESLPDYFNRIRLSVVPLRVGAGAKGKVAASLAAGVPCVSTSVGVEGMQLEAGREIAVADTAEALAAQILQVFEDEAEWRRYREEGLAYADRITSRRALRAQILAMTERLGMTPAAIETSGNGK